MKVSVNITRQIAAVLFVFSFISQSFAQHDLRGVVYNQKTGISIGQAHIHIYELDQITISDRDGYFVFENITPGFYTLIVSHVSCDQKVETIEFTGAQEDRIQLELNEKSNLLQPVEIISWYRDSDIIPKTKMESRQIVRMPARDIAEVVRHATNVSGVKKGAVSMDPVIRGFRSSQLNIQIDNGQRIEGGCPNRMDPTFSHVDISQVEEIEIIKGPYALQYGPMLGGTVRLKTIKPRFYDRPQIHVEASKGYESNWNGNKEHINVYGGGNSLYFSLAAGRKDYGNYIDGRGEEVNASFNKHYLNGEFGGQINNQHYLFYNFNYALAENIDFPVLPMDEREDITKLQSVEYKYLGKGFVQNVDFKAYVSEVDHTMDNKQRPFSDTVVAVSKIVAEVQGARMDVKLNMGILKPEIGLDFEYTQKDGDRNKHMILQPGLPIKNEILWNQAYIRNTGLFFKLEKKYKKLKWMLALRGDLNQAGSDSIKIMHPMVGEIYYKDADSTQSIHRNFSVSFGATYRILENLKFTLAGGRSMRSPDMTERFIVLLPIGYDRFDYIGNPDLKPEINNQIDLTMDCSFDKFGRVKLNGFYSLVQNYILGERISPSLQKPLTRDVLGVKRFVNHDLVLLSGAEFQFTSAEFYHFQTGVQMSMTYGVVPEVEKYIVNDANQVTGVAMVENDALAEIPPFESNIWMQHTLENGKLQNRIWLRVVAAQKHVSQSCYEETTPAFWVFNYDVTYSVNKYAELIAGVNNVFDQAYYEHLNRNILGSTRPLYEVGRSFYVSLKLKL